MPSDSALHPHGVDLVTYSADSVDERPGISADDALAAIRNANHSAAAPPILWLNISGLADSRLIKQIGDVLALHPLAMEDVVSLRQRPRVDNYDSHIYIPLKILQQDDNALTFNQLSIFLLDNLVVTFQEQPGDVLDAVRLRIRHGSGRIRQMGADYLMYSIIDTVIDNYFPCLEQINDLMEALEEKIIRNQAHKDSIEYIHRLKRDIQEVRRAIWPLRDAIGVLYRDELPNVSKAIRPFLRDCQDHAILLFDSIENCREFANSLMDIYLSTLSNRMNEIMKVLTIISTLFIPLTFIAGIYGMNFAAMPELQWRWGYAACLALMALCAAVMIWLFKRVGWLDFKQKTAITRKKRLPHQHAIAILENWLKQNK
jgi:magnesium transporter